MSEILRNSMIARLEAGEGMVRFKSVGTAQDVMLLVDEYRAAQTRFHELIQNEDLSVDHYEYKERLDRIAAKIEAIWNNPELSYTDQEIREIERYGMSADKFWEEALKSGNDVLEELANDLAEIDTPVKRDQVLFMRADKKATEELAEALEYASDVEEILAYAQGGILDVAGKANAGIAVRAMTKEEKQKADDILQEVLSGQDTGKQLTGEDIKYLANKAIAEHPVKFMISAIREAAITYREAKAACIECGRGYETALGKFKRMSGELALSIYDPTKDAILSVGRAGLATLADAACSAYEKVTDWIPELRKNISNLRNMLEKGVDRLLDIQSFGAYSHFGMMVAEAAQRYVDKAEGLYKEPVKKEKAFRPLAIKCIESIAKEMAASENSFLRKIRNSKAVVSAEEFRDHLKERASSLWEKLCFEVVSRGNYAEKSPAEYWREVSELNWNDEVWIGGNPFEGVVEMCKEAKDKVKAYEEKRDNFIASANASVENGAKQLVKTATEAKECVLGICRTAEAATILASKKTVQTVVQATDKMVLGVDSAISKAQVISQTIKADALSIQADAYTSLANAVGKFQSRIELKESRLLEADYKAAMEVKKLNESISRLANRRGASKAEYVPSEELVGFLSRLKEMPPITSIKFARSQIEAKLAKEEKAFNKKQARLEKSLDKEEKRLATELGKAELKAEKAYAKLKTVDGVIKKLDGVREPMEERACIIRAIAGSRRGPEVSRETEAPDLTKEERE